VTLLVGGSPDAAMQDFFSTVFRNPQTHREVTRLFKHGGAMLVGVLLVWMPLSLLLRVYWSNFANPLALSIPSYVAFLAIPLIFRPDIPLALVLSGIILPRMLWREERRELFVTPNPIEKILAGKLAPPCLLLIALNVGAVPLFYPNIIEDAGLRIPPTMGAYAANLTLTAFASLEDVFFALICVFFAFQEALSSDDRVGATIRACLKIAAVGIGIAVWGTLADFALGPFLIMSLNELEYVLVTNAVFLAPTLTLEYFLLRHLWTRMLRSYSSLEDI